MQHLIYSNFFVSLCTFCLCLSTAILFSVNCYRVCFFVFFATFSTYNFQRIFTEKNYISKRGVYIKKNKKILIFISLISLFFCLNLFLKFNFLTQLIMCLSAIICFLYPFYLRRVPYLKIFLISLLWSITTVLAVIIEENIVLNIEVFSHFLSRFLFVFAITIPFDIRDIKKDTSTILTLPILFGEKKVKIISFLAIFLFLLNTTLQFQLNIINLKTLISLSFLILIMALMIYRSGSSKNEYYFSFWLESLSIVFLLVILVTII